jgi:hypothetical protein
LAKTTRKRKRQEELATDDLEEEALEEVEIVHSPIDASALQCRALKTGLGSPPSHIRRKVGKKLKLSLFHKMIIGCFINYS